MRNEDYKRRKPLVLTPLRQQFLDKVSRLLYHYGEFRGGWQRLERENLLVLHNNGMMSVDFDGIPVMNHSTDGNRRTTWCSNTDLKKAMEKLDAMFVLDDLANL